ncbi:AraC family transcriptional regulator [Coraliomargarita sp. SDUM461004]|uniref:AraC family transcriptional regulator n=1 Tax=Thalassobacterium sedimentorum TaxID=3041258 RepID=A0ABU1AIM1_9BACT|nr:AraC family transcriptional regulator [Coraliomargarita sp. SDUM461004]MDQ8194664.1 AraC family transcriptional regulator [Coraliomargarita sp. SDUM461004]
MSYSWHPVENFGPPFLMVDEATFVIPKGGEVRLRKNHFKFLFILEGSIEHEIEGIEGRVSLSSGDILVAPVVDEHAYINKHSKQAHHLHLVRLFLDAEHLAKQARRRVRKPEVNFVDFILHHFASVVQLNGGIDTEITDLLVDLRRETDQQSVGYRHRVRSICTDLIVAVARKLTDTKNEEAIESGATPSSLVLGVKEYILKHLSEDMTLGEIAWHVGKGEEHLARVFKRETGQTVFDYVREVRVNRARTLILDPSLSLSEVATRCGFHSLSFFSRTFRTVTGMSPTGYRRHMAAVLTPHS